MFLSPSWVAHAAPYDDALMERSIQIWGPHAAEFDPGRHLDAGDKFVKPAPPTFIGFGAGPRLWCVSRRRVSAASSTLTTRLPSSPAAQLVAYEFVACWAGILPHFDFTPMRGTLPDGRKYQEPRLIEAFTPSLSCPLMVDVRKLDAKA